MADIEKARWARERGDILRTLKEDDAHGMTGMGTLIRVLDAQGVSLSRDEMSFHLRYLSDQGYARLSLGRDLSGYRRDRPMDISAETIMGAKLEPRGLQLLDGLIPEDPSVAF